MSARGPVAALIARFAQRLRYPTLFWITAALFALNLVIPDAIPFADEILLGLGTLVLARLTARDRRAPPAP